MSAPNDDGLEPSAAAVADAGRSVRVRASRGTMVSLVGQGIAQVLRLGGNLVLARLLFPEAFGVMAIVYLVVFALDQISNIGIGAAIMRFDRGEEPVFLDTAWTMQAIRGVGLWLVSVAATPLVASFYHMPELTTILPIAAFGVVITGLTSTKLMVLTRRLDLTRAVAIEISGQLAALVVMMTIAWMHPSVWALVWGGLVNAFVIALLSHLAIPGPGNRFAWNRDDARAIYSIGKWVLASSGVSFLLAQIDVALLGRLVPAGLLGVYTMGSVIPSLLRDLSFRLSSSVLAPVVAEANRESPGVLRERYAAARRLTLPTAMVAALGAAVVAPAFFAVLYDSRYADAGWIAQLALFRYWFAYLQVSGCLTLLSMGIGSTWAVSNVVGLIGTTAGGLIGFHVGSLPGLLIGVAIGTALGALVPIVHLQRLGVASPLPELRYTLAGLALAAVLYGAVHYSDGVVAIANPALRTLVVGGIAVAPIAVWAALRVLPEISLGTRGRVEPEPTVRPG